MLVASGSIIGAIAAVSRKAVSEVIMRVLDIIPGIALATVFVSILVVFLQSSLPIGFMYIAYCSRKLS